MVEENKPTAKVVQKRLKSSGYPARKTAVHPSKTSTKTPVNKPRNIPRSSSTKAAKAVSVDRMLQRGRSAIRNVLCPSWWSGGRLFALFALLVLVGTTMVWSFLGARSNLTNADQLVDSYLFTDWKTFQQAHFPATHTFFLKWPLFVLGAALGNSGRVIEGLTVFVVLTTVLLLAGLLFRIVRDPVKWGVLILALSLVLLLVPIQASPGTLLPVNMAMLTTRNIEYIVAIAVFLLTVRTRRFASWTFGFLVLVSGVLFLSDRLFVPIVVGATVTLAVFGVLLRRKELVRTGYQGLVGALCGFILAVGAVVILGHVTHLSLTSSASPYQLANAKGVSLGLVYGVLGGMTELGINPAATTLVLHEWPGAVVDNLRGLSGIARGVALICGLAFVFMVWRTIRREYLGRSEIEPYDGYTQLSLLLVGASLVAAASFVFTKHYYAGDSRYLAIIFFAMAVSAAVMLRRISIGIRWARDWTMLLFVAIISALYVNYQDYNGVRAARVHLAARDGAIVQILAQHQTSILVGDYWRVMPLRMLSGGKQAVMPLANCTEPRDVLTSKAWEPKPEESFAYLLTADKGLSDYPPCNFATVVQRYGRPNASVVIAGSVDSPIETLLFYDHGARRSLATRSGASVPGELRSEALADTPAADCPAGTTVTIVAHPDDDILFTSPDLPRQIAEGRCVRTVYLTAGDAGSGSFYWLGREAGAQAAYDVMAHNRHLWLSRTVKLPSEQYITSTNPASNRKISLIFFNLPDGGMHGDGFPASRHESLSKLFDGSERQINTVDNHSMYTNEQLVQGLSALLDIYAPDEVHIQSTLTSYIYPDHSDHGAAGLYGQAAIDAYGVSRPEVSFRVERYVGYPMHGLPTNLSESDRYIKQNTFLAYAKHDGAVCQSVVLCNERGVYGAYLSRQYTEAEYEAALR